MKKAGLIRLSLALGVLSCAFNIHGLVPLPPSDNLLADSGFRTNLHAWTVFGDVVWTSTDINGSASSGSAFVTSSASNGLINAGVAQCVLLPGSGPFDVGGRFFIPSGQGQAPFGGLAVYWYDNTSCSGSFLGSNALYTPVPTPTDSWTLVAAYRVTPPGGAVAASVAFGIGESESGPDVHGYVDGTFFRLTSCTPADEDLCLHGGRFRVTAQWESPIDGGHGHGVQFNDDSGWFWFFTDTNTEVVVKTVSACADPFNKYWVFAAGLTNTLVTLNVEDTAAGLANHYINPEGTAFVPIQDTSAFDTCP